MPISHAFVIDPILEFEWTIFPVVSLKPYWGNSHAQELCPTLGELPNNFWKERLGNEDMTHPFLPRQTFLRNLRFALELAMRLFFICAFAVVVYAD